MTLLQHETQSILLCVLPQDFGHYLHILPAERQQELTQGVEGSITHHDWDMTERGLHAIQSLAVLPEGAELLQVPDQQTHVVVKQVL